jgi:feruloyl esterase
MTGSAFLNQPEVTNDFGFRATHIEAELGKAIIEAYYGRSAHKSYYLGCSAGGRQGFKEAEMFPDDFDGIVAGSPAIDGNHLLDWSGFLGQYIGAPNPANSPNFITSDQWPIISQSILAQCDGLDGVLDGIITEPDNCDFRPEALLCPNSSNQAGCLTQSQVDALHKIYSPLTDSKGTVLFPRYDPGAEGDGNFEVYFSGEFFTFTSVSV